MLMWKCPDCSRAAELTLTPEIRVGDAIGCLGCGSMWTLQAGGEWHPTTEGDMARFSPVVRAVAERLREGGRG